jgi:hypothetical protein
MPGGPPGPPLFPTFAWASQSEALPAGGGFQNDAYAVAAFPDGSSVATGYFESQAVFGSTTLTSAGAQDIWLARYDPSGNVVWAKRAGGSADDAGGGVAVVGATIVVGGDFQGSATFGPGEPGQAVIASVGIQDLFVAQYGGDGTFQSIKQVGGSDAVLGAASVAPCGSNGSTLVAGFVYRQASTPGTVTFGSGEPNQTTLVAPVILHGGGFLARYNSDLTLAWAKEPTATDSFDVSRMGAFTDGSSVVAGTFSGTATFGAGEAHQTVLTSTVGTTFFLARFAPDGTLVWAKQANGEAFGRSVAALPDGTTIVGGDFRTTTVFGPGEPHETSLVPSSDDMFVARFDVDGALLWAQDPGAGEIEGAAALADGTALLCGEMATEALWLGRVSPGGALVSSTAIQATSLDHPFARALATVPDGTAILVGQFGAATLTFPGSGMLSRVGGGDIFIGRFQ